MSNVHVVSCGTSLVGAMTRSDLTFTDRTPFKGLSVLGLVGRLGTDGAATKAAHEWLFGHPEASAELTAMRAYLDRGEVDTAYLVSTRTKASRFALSALDRTLGRRGIRVEMGTSFEGYEEPDAGPDDQRLSAFAADLQVLRARTLAYVRRRQKDGDRVLIAAQGGYKPEAGIMMMVGSETGATVYYAHEEMRRSVELPVLAYTGPRDGLRALAAAAGRAAGPEVRQLLAQHPELAGSAEAAYATSTKRDGATIVMLELTEYGRLLAGRE